MQRQTQVMVYVSGTVQGVAFRVNTRKQALALELRGWVRNLPDGRVQAVFCGKESAVQAMVGWCRRGPLRAAVTGVEVVPQPIEAFSGFGVRATPDAALEQDVAEQLPE